MTFLFWLTTNLDVPLLPLLNIPRRDMSLVFTQGPLRGRGEGGGTGYSLGDQGQEGLRQSSVLTPAQKSVSVRWGRRTGKWGLGHSDITRFPGHPVSSPSSLPCSSLPRLWHNGHFSTSWDHCFWVGLALQFLEAEPAQWVSPRTSMAGDGLLPDSWDAPGFFVVGCGCCSLGCTRLVTCFFLSSLVGPQPFFSFS